MYMYIKWIQSSLELFLYFYIIISNVSVVFIVKLLIPLGRRCRSVPVNMPDPIRIRSGLGGKHWPEAGRMILAHWLASGPDPFGQNLTQSARTTSDPVGFAQYYPGRLRMNETESKSRKLVAGRMHHARNQARWFLRTSLVLDQMRLGTIWPMPSLEKRSWNGCGKSDSAYTIRPDSGCTLVVMAITGRNQTASGSDPACLLGRLVMRPPASNK